MKRTNIADAFRCSVEIGTCPSLWSEPQNSGRQLRPKTCRPSRRPWW